MYWYKFISQRNTVIVSGLLCMALWSACKPDVVIDTIPHYFNLKDYFKVEAARLTRLNHSTFKTVTHNKISEGKKVHIDNWERELSLFSESDINKPAWKDSYNIDTSGIYITYRAKATEPDLKTREVVIVKQNNKIREIMIYNSIKNLLYKNNEKLSYYPDSGYIIVKSQDVRILGSNLYTIKGLFN